MFYWNNNKNLPITLICTWNPININQVLLNLIENNDRHREVLFPLRQVPLNLPQLLGMLVRKRMWSHQIANQFKTKATRENCTYQFKYASWLTAKHGVIISFFSLPSYYAKVSSIFVLHNIFEGYDFHGSSCLPYLLEWENTSTLYVIVSIFKMLYCANTFPYFLPTSPICDCLAHTRLPFLSSLKK